MKIGNQPAFPRAYSVVTDQAGNDSDIPAQTGITYRQWLIGMIACSDGTDEDWVIERADAIIAKLESEEK